MQQRFESLARARGRLLDLIGDMQGACGPAFPICADCTAPACRKSFGRTGATCSTCARWDRAGGGERWRKYSRFFQHLSAPAPGRGSSGVHEFGFGRFNPETLSLSPNAIPTLQVVDASGEVVVPRQ